MRSAIVTACAASSSRPKMFRMPEQGGAGRVPDPPPALVGVPGAERADQQVAGDRGHGDDHGVGPGVLPVQADVGDHGEQQPGRQPGAGRDQPPAQGGHEQGGHGHGDGRRQPQRELAVAEQPDDDPGQRVVGAVHGIDVAEHRDHVAERPLDRGQRGRLVAPVGRHGDADQHHGEGHDRRREPHPPRPGLVFLQVTPALRGCREAPALLVPVARRSSARPLGELIAGSSTIAATSRGAASSTST